MKFSAAYLFVLPVVYSLLEFSEQEQQFDYTYLATAFVCALVGTIAQYADKSETGKVSKKEMFTIISFSSLITLIAYIIGKWKGGILVTMLVGGVGGAMSVDLIRGLKKSLVGIASGLKPLWDKIVKAKFNVKDQNDEEDNNFPPGASPV